MATQVAVENAQAVRWFHALSDETRLEILQLLSNGERCVCELTDALDAAQSRLSFHLKTLKDADLVTDRREGRWVYYSLNPESFEQIEALVGVMAGNDGAAFLKRAPSRRLKVKRAGECCD
jgi:ArsR family transcriptional regulator, arsenate/arsenite/antimonite-responsive transcriptional repressor